MGYNLSRAAFERLQPQLDKLLPGYSVEFTTLSPATLAYRLREAIKSAQAYKIEPYASLDFSFHTRKGKVIARPKSELVLETRKEHSQITGARSHFEVIGAMKDATTPVVVFPDFNGELQPIVRWAQAKGYTVDIDPVLMLTKE